MFGNLFGDAASASSSLFNPAFAKPAEVAPPPVEKKKVAKASKRGEQQADVEKKVKKEKREKESNAPTAKGEAYAEMAKRAKQAKEVEAKAEAAPKKKKKRKYDDDTVQIETEDDPDKPRVKPKVIIPHTFPLRPVHDDS